MFYCSVYFENAANPVLGDETRTESIGDSEIAIRLDKVESDIIVLASPLFVSSSRRLVSIFYKSFIISLVCWPVNVKCKTIKKFRHL